MKRLLCIFLCAISTLHLFSQDEKQSIKITVNSNEPTTAKYDLCNLAVTATQSGDSDISLSIEVENNNSSYNLFLFGQSYPEKVLKKRKPSIRFDKKSYGTTSREILTCEGLNGDEVLQIEGDKSRTLTMSKVKGEPIRCELPFYIAKTKNRKKYFIIERVKITLNVELIEDEPDPSAYEDIKKKYDDLASEIETIRICPHKKHPVSMDDQKKPYLNKVENLKNDINEIREKYNWKERDKAYKPYKDILEKLQSEPNFKTEDCEKCVPPRSNSGSQHQCKYCEMSPESVLKTMESIYKKLDQGNIKKSDAISSAELIYNACNKSCRTLKKKVDKNANLKNKINRYYQSIVNY